MICDYWLDRNEMYISPCRLSLPFCFIHYADTFSYLCGMLCMLSILSGNKYQMCVYMWVYGYVSSCLLCEYVDHSIQFNVVGKRSTEIVCSIIMNAMIWLNNWKYSHQRFHIKNYFLFINFIRHRTVIDFSN